jgi:hypothetical protein
MPKEKVAPLLHDCILHLPLHPIRRQLIDVLTRKTQQLLPRIAVKTACCAVGVHKPSVDQIDQQLDRLVTFEHLAVRLLFLFKRVLCPLALGQLLARRAVEPGVADGNCQRISQARQQQFVRLTKGSANLADHLEHTYSLPSSANRGRKIGAKASS